MSFAPQTPLDGVTYPEPSDVQSWTENGALTRQTLAEGFRAACHEFSERTAIASPDRSYTYKELDTLTDSVAAGLLSNGLRPLDRIIFQLSNAPETLVAFLACWKAGIIPVCTLAAHRESEIVYLSDIAEAKAHFIETDADKFDFTAFARSIAKKNPEMGTIISTKGPAFPEVLTFEQIAVRDATEAKRILSEVPQDPYQVAAFQLSGGTTGVPKIITRMQAEYLYNMRQVASFKGWTRDDRMLVPMPFVHNLNVGCAWGPMLMIGGCVIATPKPDRETITQTINTLRPTVMGAAKPIVMRMKSAISDGDIDASSIREIFSTDAAAIVERDLGISGHHIFGMTEGTIMFTREGDPEDRRFGTCGQPISTFDQVRLLVPGTEKEVVAGEIGELAVFGPYTIRGYYKSPERNLEVFTSDGFYRSGDLMRCHLFDGRRYYSFEGRIKDVVDRANEKINCEEVERAIMQHPSFSDVAVVGMPCPTHGERVCLFAVAKDSSPLPSVEELGQFLKRSGLAVFKWPERIEPINALPLTKVGKLDKASLRELISKRLVAERENVRA